jgi:hypothetical protein
VKDNSAIEVIVPAPWRLAGRLFVLVWFLASVAYIWLLSLPQTSQENDIEIMAIMHFIATPIMICYYLPIFINRYPGWFVRLVGRNHLLKMIDNLNRKLGPNREEKAHILMPHAWFDDKRVFWIVMMIGLALLGFFWAIGWL